MGKQAGARVSVTGVVREGVQPPWIKGHQPGARRLLAVPVLSLALASCSSLLAGARTPSMATAPTTMTPTTTSTPLPTQPDRTPVTPPAYLCNAITVDDTTFSSGSAEIVTGNPGFALVAAHITELRRLGVPATITIVGHTDSAPRPAPGGNQFLSEERAAAVKATLEAHGVQTQWIAAVYGVADSQPIAAGDDPTSRALNRRVEVLFHCP